MSEVVEEDSEVHLQGRDRLLPIGPVDGPPDNYLSEWTLMLLPALGVPVVSLVIDVDQEPFKVGLLENRLVATGCKLAETCVQNPVEFGNHFWVDVGAKLFHVTF